MTSPDHDSINLVYIWPIVIKANAIVPIIRFNGRTKQCEREQSFNHKHLIRDS